MTRSGNYVRGVIDQNPPRVNNPAFHLRDNGEFVAKVPEDGIPAIEDTTPGKADCEIFVIDSDGELVAEQDRTTPVTRAVYNISDSQVAGDSYVAAMLVGHELVAMAGGGGGAARIFKTPSGGIPSRNETTDEVSSADCIEYEIDDSNILSEITPQVTESVSNPFLGDICQEAVIIAVEIGGDWVIVAEECVCEPEDGPVNP